MRLTPSSSTRPAELRPRLVGLLATASLIVSCAVSPAWAQSLRDLYRITSGTSSNHMEYHRLKISSGQEALLADLQGPGLVTYFYITDDSRGQFYPGLVLKVFWDDEKEPSIHAPLSDFFGAFESRSIDYQSLPMQINHYCFTCYLPMPFSQRARFVLANDGDREYDRPVAYGIDYEKDEQQSRERSRLHCCWRRSNPTAEGLHTILDVRGRGQYVGNFLQVHSRLQGWWGEGDTVFHVDGNKLTHTPGTEDEYGSCWDFEHTYSYIYSGYIQMEAGRNRMYRWYLTNPVRFQKSLKVEIQNQRYVQDQGQVPSRDDYTSEAFWYQEEPHESFNLAPFTERTAPSGAVELK